MYLYFFGNDIKQTKLAELAPYHYDLLNLVLVFNLYCRCLSVGKLTFYANLFSPKIRF